MNSKELVEIKKGNTGTGLLIENDGYISMDKGNNKMLKEDVENHNDWYVPYPFVVDAVFQKYDIKNANGRIYPEAILKKQVELYQQRIAEHRAYGECYKPSAMILTSKGWKCLSEVTKGEEILTLNTDTNEIEIKPILNKIEKDFNGKLVHLKNNRIDESVTPNHEYIIYNNKDKFVKRIKASELLNKSFANYYIPKKGEWKGKNDAFITISGIANSEIENMSDASKEKYSKDLVLPMNQFAKFMGIYLSEGCCDKTSEGSRIFIYQRKENVANEIEDMLKELGLPFKKETTINKEDNKNTQVFVICDMRLCKYLQQFGLCYDKFVPQIIKEQNKETLLTFYQWFVKGDGRIRGDKRTRTKLTDDVFSTSKQLVLDLNEIQLKIGYSGTFHVEKRNNDRYIGKRLIKAENTHPMYFSLKSTAKGMRLDKKHLTVEEEEYQGQVMCVEVENHTWYVMENGKCHWTSNCNHPSESTIDLGRISHNITELHWEGHTLVGKMELNISEGYRRSGICSTLGDTVANLLLNGYKIGVSSRGVGSVENKFGTYVVGDDFELICWDVVSEPSTPGAYIGHKEDLQQYVESDNTKKKDSIIDEKINKIKNILKG